MEEEVDGLYAAEGPAELQSPVAASPPAANLSAPTTLHAVAGPISK